MDSNVGKFPSLPPSLPPIFNSKIDSASHPLGAFSFKPRITLKIALLEGWLPAWQGFLSFPM